MVVLSDFHGINWNIRDRFVGISEGGMCPDLVKCEVDILFWSAAQAHPFDSIHPVMISEQHQSTIGMLQLPFPVALFITYWQLSLLCM